MRVKRQMPPPPPPPNRWCSLVNTNVPCAEVTVEAEHYFHTTPDVIMCQCHVNHGGIKTRKIGGQLEWAGEKAANGG
jgi:hypothetical protein